MGGAARSGDTVRAVIQSPKCLIGANQLAEDTLDSLGFFGVRSSRDARRAYAGLPS